MSLATSLCTSPEPAVRLAVADGPDQVLQACATQRLVAEAGVLAPLGPGERDVAPPPGLAAHVPDLAVPCLPVARA